MFKKLIIRHRGGNFFCAVAKLTKFIIISDEKKFCGGRCQKVEELQVKRVRYEGVHLTLPPHIFSVQVKSRSMLYHWPVGASSE